MKRFAFALLIAACLLGSVALCQYGLTRQVNIQITPEVHDETRQHDEGPVGNLYQLTLTPAFDVVSDPFALRLDEEVPPVRLLVREGARDVLRWSDDIRSGESVSVKDVALAADTAEFYVEAAPNVESARLPCALRLQIFRDEVLMADETLWSNGGGAPIAQRIRIELERERHTLDRGLGGEES